MLQNGIAVYSQGKKLNSDGCLKSDYIIKYNRALLSIRKTKVGGNYKLELKLLNFLKFK